MNIKSLIKNLNTTQKQVANDLGLTPQTLNNYINEKTAPDIKTLKNIADYFHTTIDNIVGHKTHNQSDKNTLTTNKKKL